MARYEAPLRLLPGESPETEWRYLANETLTGERCIVPILERMLDHPATTPTLRGALMEQLDEEIEHVHMYESVIGEEQLIGTGYADEFGKLVQQIDKLTLQMFAVQVMLEGISVGSLAFRIHHWGQCPTVSADKRVLADEHRHLKVPYPHLSNLRAAEGVIGRDEFKAVSRSVNAIFKTHFSGTAIHQHLVDNYGVSRSSPEEIEKTLAMRQFRQRSRKTLAKTKSNFYSQYDG